MNFSAAAGNDLIQCIMAKLSFNVLRLRDFRLLLAARTCTVMALQAQAVIVGWQVYSITKDPLLLGLTGLVEAVPAIFLRVVRRAFRRYRPAAPDLPVLPRGTDAEHGFSFDRGRRVYSARQRRDCPVHFRRGIYFRPGAEFRDARRVFDFAAYRFAK